MPSSKRSNVAATSDALSTERFREVERPSIVTLYGSCVTAGDTLSLALGSREIGVDLEPNIESAVDAVDTDRDLLVKEEPVGVGILHLRVVCTTAINYLLLVEAVA